ncbi:MAG: hypothetical protein D6772_09975 [Bacteroidetes bacterium]|nr:MAG: hypothetical protein D6772_09975 [Bacteroidota bacterium]
MIHEAECEDLCDDRLVYEIELEDGPGPDLELYYDREWNFLFSATEISSNTLPEAVISAINAAYPNAFLDDHAERWEFPDGSLQYEVEVERSHGSDLDIVVDEQGRIQCEDS